ncbi:bifunctional diaminohydroxyphosphoribosylaminopyrimidine deaminase/5-amino-6-(5-phosphoribosylamino)uracil reductase RibD [Candidatus Peregrinibacteria bacterium]|jgi:diaminohydroxyphosphoribosylaminopyrimidine deaminase / 5-amino-6-(5-phosphoribosylamino)uracil reductase|nr:bifunctional diaminohydroxyphosphoribosylaminopyrimidine deaminase/5-amino-6-(5-phosphoribosylamino)uracil reductase RibD [Candidatus Peregrinibacteria bacterium]MBT4148295.1 bifunctional diaminohydroxyphosphoribosylaminopyrimidine deaminase/5-amino-6-(5-phosphoribosylamino)uracil reductase RibD [Candidatus Peregrinibacteria bacterium]MBT4366432.1 bifunctional diaminohydroxyphosphoribosylaminopyrimidine deaminase/5-amino-6-(5-phosphoribosylamino)uracil reductase RibD [Candidatus Peregrinibacte
MDQEFMKKALTLAKKGSGLTSPNPLVGAVIVKRGKIIGRGYHKKAGQDHAEIVAIKDALKNKNSLKGTTLYCTLEPCCHSGKTGPCANEIVRFGMKKVFFSHVDPFGKVNGKGEKFLRKNGVEVFKGLLEPEARALNQPFLKVNKTGLPFVTLKAGISLDGKIATRAGKSEWITNSLSRSHGKELRDKYDAIVVGANTIVIDNPVLACKKGRLLRVIMDGKLKIDKKSKVFRDDDVVVITTSLATKKKINKFEKAGIKVVKIGSKKIDIKRMLRFLNKNYGVQSVFVEGGGETNGSFVDASMVDDVYFYISPEIIGGRDAVSVVGGLGALNLKKSLKLKNVDVEKLKDDILVHGIVNNY